EIAQLPRHTADTIRCNQRSISYSGKVVGAAIGYGQAGSLAAEPVARVVAIAVHQVHLDAAVEEVRCRIEEANGNEVKCVGELRVYSGANKTIVNRDTECGEDRRL